MVLTRKMGPVDDPKGQRPNILIQSKKQRGGNKSQSRKRPRNDEGGTAAPRDLASPSDQEQERHREIELFRGVQSEDEGERAGAAGRDEIGSIVEPRGDVGRVSGKEEAERTDSAFGTGREGGEDEAQVSQPEPSFFTDLATTHQLGQQTQTVTPAPPNSNTESINGLQSGGESALDVHQRQTIEPEQQDRTSNFAMFEWQQTQQHLQRLEEDVKSVSMQLSSQAHMLDRILRYFERQHQEVQGSSSTSAQPNPAPGAKAGGGAKPNRVLTNPFSKELRLQMGMGSRTKQRLPDYPGEGAWPERDGHRLVRLDWSKDYDCKENREVVRKILQQLKADPDHPYSQIEDNDKFEWLYGQCLNTIKHRYKLRRREERMSEEDKLRKEQQKRRKRRLADKKQVRKQELGSLRNQDIAQRYGLMCDAIVEAASEDETNDDEAGPGPNPNPTEPIPERKSRLVLQPWRSQELEEMMHMLNRRHKAHVSGVGRQVLRPNFATNPSPSATTSPIPEPVYRWMVSHAFATTFPSLVLHVRANILTEWVHTSMQWGAPPPFEVRNPAVQGLGFNANAAIVADAAGSWKEGPPVTTLRQGQEELESRAGILGEIDPAVQCDSEYMS